MYLFREKKVFSFDTTEADDNVVEPEAFIDSNDVKILFAHRAKHIYFLLFQKMLLIKWTKTKKWKKQKMCIIVYLKKDVELKRSASEADSSFHEYGNGGQNVRYGVDF